MFRIAFCVWTRWVNLMLWLCILQVTSPMGHNHSLPAAKPLRNLSWPGLQKGLPIFHRHERWPPMRFLALLSSSDSLPRTPSLQVIIKPCSKNSIYDHLTLLSNIRVTMTFVASRRWRDCKPGSVCHTDMSCGELIKLRTLYKTEFLIHQTVDVNEIIETVIVMIQISIWSSARVKSYRPVHPFCVKKVRVPVDWWIPFIMGQFPVHLVTIQKKDGWHPWYPSHNSRDLRMSKLGGMLPTVTTYPMVQLDEYLPSTWHL